MPEQRPKTFESKLEISQRCFTTNSMVLLARRALELQIIGDVWHGIEMPRGMGSTRPKKIGIASDVTEAILDNKHSWK
jgi:hypothetical protein